MPALIFRLSLIFGLLLGAATAQAQLAEYRLGPGDKISVKVFGHDDLAAEATVDANGRVTLPLLGQVAAAPLQVHELQDEIARRLNEDYIVEPKVSVEITKYRPFFILGEVEKPGRYDYTLGITVRMAIAVASGYTKRAREEPVVIVRENAEGQGVRYRARLDTLVFPGDTIQIQRRLF